METTKTQGTVRNAHAVFNACDAAARRLLDIVAAAVGLLLLSPLFLIIAYLIKRDSPGPVFYFGPRLGKNGKPFGIVKFRTMYERKDSYEGPRITAAGDTRVTPLGRWLRDTKINELPQLWNVLVGDMSLVGPRPEDPEIAKSWPAGLREELLSVRPGITSPATVIFRSEEEMLSTSSLLDDYLRTILPDKLRLDLKYIRKRSLLTDLDVIFMTMLLLLPRLRKSRVPETTLYWGPLAQFASRYLNWFCLDTLVAFLAITAAGMLWRVGSPLNIGPWRSLLIALAVGLCFGLVNAALGLTQIQWRRAPAWQVIPLGFSAACTTLVLILIDLLILRSLGGGQLSRLPLGMLVMTGMFAFLGFAAMRYRERLLTGFATYWLNARGPRKVAGERVLLIGAGQNSQLATWLLTHSEFARMFSISGIVDDDPRKQGLYYDGYRVLGTTRDIRALVEQHDIGLAILTIDHLDERDKKRILNACRTAQVRVVILPDVMAELRAYFRAETGQRQPHFAPIGD